MKNKSRHQKFFNDKFLITTTKVKNSMKENIISIIKEQFRKLNKKNPYIKMSNQLLKELLIKNSLYEGVFYISPNDVNSLLNLNLETVHSNLSKLEKQNHGETSWDCDNNEFQKVFVISNDGENAIIAVTYNDAWCQYIFDIIPTNNIFFEGNIGKNILKNI